MYAENPYLWSWGNFDGVHFLSIAQDGYKPLQYFFFPLFPKLVGVVGDLLGNSVLNYFWSGLFVSNIAFIIGLIGLVRLMHKEFDTKTTNLTLLLLLLFPTSFYFHAFYSESLFLALSVWSFYFLKERKWIEAGLLIGLATATRVVGIALIPALVLEMWRQKKKVTISKILSFLFSVSGITSYLFYLQKVTGDPLEFLHSVGIYGEQRSSQLILLPQVFYRYIFKILPNIQYSYFPAVFTTWMEFIVAVLAAGLLILSLIAKVRKIKGLTVLKTMNGSYIVYAVFLYLIPTFSGSFSSLPRYTIVIFPLFITASILLQKVSLLVKYLVYCVLLVSLIVSFSLFVRGYWIS